MLLRIYNVYVLCRSHAGPVSPLFMRHTSIQARPDYNVRCPVGVDILYWAGPSFQEGFWRLVRILLLSRCLQDVAWSWSELSESETVPLLISASVSGIRFVHNFRCSFSQFQVDFRVSNVDNRWVAACPLTSYVCPAYYHRRPKCVFEDSDDCKPQASAYFATTGCEDKCKQYPRDIRKRFAYYESLSKQEDFGYE